jgi:predicted metalloprotease with PDZ domain
MNFTSLFKALAPIFVFTAASVSAQPDNGREAHRLVLDLIHIDDKTVEVTLYPPAIDADTAIYNMPKIVPGTYSISDFGRFTEGFHAISRKGDTLTTVRLDTNRRAIAGARDLDFVRYRVSGTFDAPMSGGIFEPGGTNISAGENVLLNMFGFAGYFDGTKNTPFEVEILRPAGW